MLSAVWMAKPFLSCQLSSHQPPSHPPASTRLPPGIFATISLPVPGAARRLTVDATYAGFARTGPATQAMASPQKNGATFITLSSRPRAFASAKAQEISARKKAGNRRRPAKSFELDLFELPPLSESSCNISAVDGQHRTAGLGRQREAYESIGNIFGQDLTPEQIAGKIFMFADTTYFGPLLYQIASQ